MLRSLVTFSDMQQVLTGFASPVLSKCSHVPAPSPPSPRVPMVPWWHMLLYVVAACAGAAFAPFIWHQRAHKGQLRQLDSQEGHSLLTMVTPKV